MENQEYAGFWIRFVANLIDGVVLGLPVYALNWVVYMQVLGISPIEYEMASLDNTTVGSGTLMYTEPWEVLVWIIPIRIVAGVLYYGILTSSKLQGTLGKRAMGLKVVGEDGKRITFGRSLLRFVGYLPSTYLLYIGYLMVGWTEKKQGLHDKIAATYVVKSS